MISKEELIRDISSIAPWSGSLEQLKEHLNITGSNQQLSSKICHSKDRLAALGVTIERPPRTDSYKTREIIFTKNQAQPTILFDGSRNQHTQENHMIENDSTTPSPGLGVRLVWEVSEEALKAFFAVLPLLKTEQMKTLGKALNDHVTYKATSTKTTQPTPFTFSPATKPENVQKTTKKPKKGKTLYVKCVRKDDLKGEPKYRLRDAVERSGNYVIV